MGLSGDHGEGAQQIDPQIDVELRVIRVTPSAIFITTKTVGSSQPPKDMFVGLDWSRVRDVNGKETVVNRPLAFPLSDKKTWEVTYTEENPNKKHKSEKLDNRFTVVGYEAVEVPAGKYKALLKIEAEGRWEAGVAQGAETNDPREFQRRAILMTLAALCFLGCTGRLGA